MKKFLAGFFAFIILILFPIVLLSTITIYWVFTPNTVKQIIHASEIGEHLPTLLVTLAAEQAGNGADFSTAAELVGSTFSGKDVYALTDPLVDNVSVWFNTDQPIEQLNLAIDSSAIKAKLIPEITKQLSQSGIEDIDTTALTDEISKNIPDTVNGQDLLQEQLIRNGGASQLALVNQQVNLYRLYWNWLHWLVWIGWIVIGCCCVFIILLRLHPRYAPFGWLAWLAVLKLLELIPIILAVWLAPQFILPWITGSFDSAVVTVINQAVSALFKVYLWPLVVVLAGLGCSSIVWFIIRALVKHHGSNVTPS